MTPEDLNQLAEDRRRRLQACSQVHTFADGELSEADAESFRRHLASCPACQRELRDALLLNSLVEGAFAQGPLRSPRRPTRWALRAATLALPVAATLLLIVRFAPRAASPDPWLSDAPSRPLEARLSTAGADRYRPYNVSRTAPAAAPPAPLKVLAALEEQGDLRGLAAAYLLRAQPEQAAAYLRQAPPSPATLSDQAILALQRGAHDEALGLIDRALRESPRHPQALWNKGLVLRELGLLMGAAESFAQVAALGETGWSAEASARAEALRRELSDRKSAWRAAFAACRAMVAQGEPISADVARRYPGIARLFFYDAVRAAPSPERVRALLPLAAELDALYGETTLTRYATRIAARDFRRRRPLAETYGRLATGALPASARERFLAELRRSGEQDLLLGALVFGGLAGHLHEYRALAASMDDPWFTLLAEEKQAEADLDNGQVLASMDRVLRVLPRCEGSRLDHRCTALERMLARDYTFLHQPVEAREHTLKALQYALRERDGWMELILLRELGQTARLRIDVPLTHAYLEEVLLRDPDSCDNQEFVHSNLATVHQLVLDFEGTRREIDLATRCGKVTLLATAFTLADVARVLPRPTDAPLLKDGLDRLRAGTGLDPGRRLVADHIEGRFELERDRRLGESLLRHTVARAEPFPASDVHARKARTYSYTSLILDAGEHGEWEQALGLFAEELSAPAPPRCVLGVTMDDERLLVVGRGARGELLGRYDASRRAPLAADTVLVPADLTGALRACESVEVLARPPLQGRPGLLPPEVAWSYRLSHPSPPAGPLPRRRLVVTNVTPPPALRLPRLADWGASSRSSPGTVVLEGISATPSRVLAAMADATEIEVHAHGLIDQAQSDASLLVLSPDGNGRFTLTGSELRQQPLRGQPMVLLAACHAAHTAPYLSETYSLPAAFIAAGARLVLASTQEIPDAEAALFFDPVMARIEAGQPPAVALRDERLAWRRAGRSPWVEQVLLFQ